MATFKVKKPDGSWDYIGSEGIKVDTGLVQAGMAADAKAVGDALATKQPVGNYATQTYVDTALENIDIDGFVPIDGGTMEGALVADEISSGSLAAVQVRNIVSVTEDPGAGSASTYPNGTVVLVRE